MSFLQEIIFPTQEKDPKNDKLNKESTNVKTLPLEVDQDSTLPQPMETNLSEELENYISYCFAEDQITPFLSRAFFHGKTNTGKSSLAFHFAYEEASYGGIPLFITHREKLEMKFPLRILQGEDGDETEIIGKGRGMEEGGGFNPTVLSRIQMKYLSSYEEFIRLFAGIQIFYPIPSLLIIDDLSSFLPPSLAFHSSSSSSTSLETHQKSLDAYLFLLGLLDDAIIYLQSAHEEEAGEDDNGKIGQEALGIEEEGLLREEKEKKEKEKKKTRMKVIVCDNLEDQTAIHYLQHYMDEIISFHPSPHPEEKKVILKKFLINQKSQPQSQPQQQSMNQESHDLIPEKAQLEEIIGSLSLTENDNSNSVLYLHK